MRVIWVKDLKVLYMLQSISMYNSKFKWLHVELYSMKQLQWNIDNNRCSYYVSLNLFYTNVYTMLFSFHTQMWCSYKMFQRNLWHAPHFYIFITWLGEVQLKPHEL